MNEKINELMRTVEQSDPPGGMKERVLSRVLRESVELGPVQRLIFLHPWRAAGVISVVVSGVLWAVLGDSYPMLLLR